MNISEDFNCLTFALYVYTVFVIVAKFIMCLDHVIRKFIHILYVLE